MEDHPEVFISYSHDNPEHETWVGELGAQLMSHGVIVNLDQWDLRLGSNLAAFMEQGLSKSKLVLCVCSEAYVEKSNSGVGGTGYESAIIKQPLLEDVNTDNIICIVRNNTKKTRPTALSSSFYIDFSNDANYFESYAKLLERIYDKDIDKKPTLGESPFSSTKTRTILDKINLESIKYMKSELSGTASFNFTNNDGKFTIGRGSYEFVTQWTRADNDSIYAYKDEKLGYLESNVEYPEKDKLDMFDYTSRLRCMNENEVFILINKFDKIAAIKVIKIDNNFLTFEYKIYD